MSQAEVRILKFGGGSFIIGGILLLAANLLLVFLSPPPTTQASFLQWLATNKSPIFMSNEVLFFATLFLVPSFIALGKLLGTGSKVSAFAGLSIIALALPLLAMLIVVQGRLVDPVFNLDLSADTLKFAFSMFYGGLHAILLMFGAALLFIGFAMRGTIFHKGMVPLSYLTGVLQITGAFPWLTPITFNVIVPASLSLWMVLTGTIMLRGKAKQGTHDHNADV